jgi:glutamyl-tRNA reductase
MSELAARQMVRDGARASVLGGRTLDKAEQLAAALGGRAAPFEALRSELARADIVISGTGAAGVIIHRQDIEAAQAARRGRPLFLIDIAVPRDIADDASSVSGVFLYDLDDVKTVAEANLRERKKEAAAAESILHDEIRGFLEWQRSLDVVPLLVELRRRADEIRKAEIDKARHRLGPLTPEQENALEAATAGIVNKLLHGPTVQLKEMAGRGQPEHVGLIRKLFGLSHNATIGSTVAARRAGRAEATIATRSSSARGSRIELGSLGRLSYNSQVTNRESHRPAARPKLVPSAT